MSRSTHTHLLTIAVLALTIGLSACDRGPERVELRVFAASSLTESFGALARSFEREHPGVDVRVTYAGSQVLRLQIEQGADANVFASANLEHTDALIKARIIRYHEIFANNALVVIVPEGNPADIATFDDLAGAERLVIGAPTTPIGAYTQEMFRLVELRRGAALASKMRGAVVSEEPNTRLVRAKVELGEADAAIVYQTDALASSRVEVVQIPPGCNVKARYDIGRLERSRRSSLAKAFMAHVRSVEGRAILTRHGFTQETR